MKNGWLMSPLGLVLSIAIATASTGGAYAQSYPTKPIRIVTAFATGGAADILARIIGAKLTERLGQPVLVESRPGAGGNIAAETVAKSPPDGYTLIIYSTAHAVNVTLYSKLSYDLVKDLAPVSLLASMASILAVNPSVPAHSVNELIALAKARPGQLNFGSAGHGSTQHLSGELFKTMAGIDIAHIPYKGGAPVMTALLSGEIAMVFNLMSVVLPQMKAGKLRAVAVSSAKRSPMVPELPTVSEAGLPGFELITYVGLLAPAGTPPDTITKLNAEITSILGMPDTKERFFSNGAEPLSSTPEQFGEFIKQDIAKMGKLVRQSGARVD